MARSHHNNKKTDIKNFALQIVRFKKHQLLKNDTDNHEISSTPKSTKKQEYESFFRRKSLKKYIIS